MEKELSFSNFYKHPRFWRHAIPWIVFFAFVGLMAALEEMVNPTPAATEQIINSIESESKKAEGTLNSPFTFLNLLLQVLILIYGSFYAYNKLFKKKRYGLMVAIFLGLIILTALLGSNNNDTGGVQVGVLKGFWANLIIFPFILLVAFGFKLAYHGIRQVFIIQKLESKQTESELKLLKSQVNPHFLFNTLNNIYSTNLENPEKANEIILELADLLRYQLESGKKQLTSLQQEITSLENYVALEKIRVLDCQIEIEKKGDFDNAEIVPLLLLPFVENAFKYGTGIERGEIELRFDLNEQQLFSFYCKNKIVQRNGKIHSGGIGLENVKKRLELMYNGKYELHLNESPTHFEVDLTMKLK